MNILTFVLAFVLFVGGIVLMGYGWDGTVFHPFVFAGGLLAISLATALPFHILKHTDR